MKHKGLTIHIITPAQEELNISEERNLKISFLLLKCCAIQRASFHIFVQIVIYEFVKKYFQLLSRIYN